MIVLRHDLGVDVRAGCEQHAAVVSALIAGARTRPDLLAALQQAAWRYAGFVSVDDSDAPELDRALRVALQAGIALFELAHVGRAEAVLGGERATLVADGPLPGVGPDGRRQTVLLAAILRDDEAIAALSALPGTAVHGAGNPDAIAVLRDRATMAVLLQRPEASAVIRAASQAVDHHKRRVGTELTEVTAELELLQALVHGDPREFNRSLLRAVEEHRRLFSGEAADDPRGFLALGALGVAAAAHDRGLRVEVQSDYMPLRLILGDLERESTAISGELVAATEAGASRFVLCPLCGSPIGKRHRTCPTCRSELVHTTPLEFGLPELAMLPRVPCRTCGEGILALATICPRCRAWQQPDDEVVGPEEVSLRAFPAEYQLFLVDRPYAPARFAILLPLGVPGADEMGARLPLGGFEVLVVASAGGEVIEIDLRGTDGETVTVQVRPLAADALPGFERDALGLAAAPVRAALEFTVPLGPDLLAGMQRAFRLAVAIAPDGVGAVDLDTGGVWSPDGLRDAAESAAPPDPAGLYAVRTLVSGDRAWIATRGLLRCGVFEIEAFDVPVALATRVAAVIDAAARVLIDLGAALPAEEEPFAVGELTLAWVPSGWIRDREPGAFGVRPEHRSGYDPLSVVLVGVVKGGQRPLTDVVDPSAVLAPPPSRLDLAFDHGVAAATLPRLRALRLAHAWDVGWQFLVKLRVDDGTTHVVTRWFRLQDLGETALEGVLQGEGYGGIKPGARARLGLSDLVGWEVEGPAGRTDQADAIGEMRSELRLARERQRSESTATPLLAECAASGEVTATPLPHRTAEEVRVMQRARTPEPAPAVAPPPPVVEKSAGPRWIPIALSLVWPGLGHVYLGEARRGLAFMGFGAITLFLFGLVNVVAAIECWQMTAPPGES